MAERVGFGCRAFRNCVRYLDFDDISQYPCMFQAYSSKHSRVLPSTRENSRHQGKGKKTVSQYQKRDCARGAGFANRTGIRVGTIEVLLVEQTSGEGLFDERPRLIESGAVSFLSSDPPEPRDRQPTCFWSVGTSNKHFGNDLSACSSCTLQAAEVFSP